MKRIMSCIFAFAVLVYLTGTAFAYSDIKPGSWCEQAVSVLTEDGVIAGYEDGTFRANLPITRAQFVCLLFRMGKNKSDMTQDERERALFADVSKNDWFFEGVQWGAESGMIDGYNSMFYPNRNITRQEAACILARFLADNGKHVVAETTEFLDSRDISAWAADAVAVCHELGLMNGRTTEQFVPLEFCTRGEAATIVLRLQNLISPIGENSVERIVVSHYAYGKIIREFNIDLPHMQCLEFKSPDMVTQRNPNDENCGYQTIHQMAEDEEFIVKLSTAGFFEWNGTYQRTYENGYYADEALVTIDVVYSDNSSKRITCDGAFPDNWEDVKAVFEDACTVDILCYTP